MKSNRTLGFVTAIAAVTMAFIGTTAASATNTSLCREDSLPTTGACPAGKLVKTITLLDGSLLMLTSILNITCHVIISGNVTNPSLLGSPLEISGTIAYLGCNNGCEIKQISPETRLKILKTATELSEVTYVNEVLEQCGELIHCVFNGTSLIGHGLGGLTTTVAEKVHVSLTKAVLTKVSGFLCPSTTELDALFVSTEKLFIRS
jgi:hypothetical protein